jgi:hypothetical protein
MADRSRDQWASAPCILRCIEALSATTAVLVSLTNVMYSCTPPTTLVYSVDVAFACVCCSSLVVPEVATFSFDVLPFHTR